MNRGKKTGNSAPDSLPSKNAGGPVWIPPKTQINIIIFLFSVFTALVILTYVLHGLYTGELLTIGKITLLYDKILTARTGNVVLALCSLSVALFLLTYGVCGLRRGGLRNYIPGRYGFSDTTYYQGLPMWVLFLSYLSLSVYAIASAVQLVYSDKPLNASRAAWKWKDVHNVPLFLWVGFIFIAGWLDSAIGGRDMRDVLATLRERFGRDSAGKKALLDKGIADDRKTFFEYLAENDIETVKLFLDAGMHVDGVDPLNINTPLSSAARNGHRALVKLLLERKADVNKAAKRGLPPLWSTVYDFDDTTILRLLVKHNADVGARNADGETVLMRAAAALSLDTARFLVENKADVNARAKDGHTALLHAVESIDYETDEDDRAVVEKDSYNMVKYLLEHGADPNVKLLKSGSKNNTPLRIARSKKVKEVAELLEEYHAKE